MESLIREIYMFILIDKYNMKDLIVAYDDIEFGPYIIAGMGEKQKRRTNHKTVQGHLNNLK